MMPPFQVPEVPVGFMQPLPGVYGQHPGRGHSQYFEEAPCLYMPHPSPSRLQDIKQFHHRQPPSPHIQHLHHNHPPPVLPHKEMGRRAPDRHHVHPHQHPLAAEMCCPNHPPAAYRCAYPEGMMGHSHHGGMIYGYPIPPPSSGHKKRSSRSSGEKLPPGERIIKQTNEDHSGLV